ncbi:MAG: hypothetical protein AAF770_01380 [Bacteroidota bacterium]
MFNSLLNNKKIKTVAYRLFTMSYFLLGSMGVQAAGEGNTNSKFTFHSVKDNKDSRNFLKAIAKEVKYKGEQYSKVVKLEDVTDKILVNFLVIISNNKNNKNNKNLEAAYNSEKKGLKNGEQAKKAQQSIKKDIFDYIIWYKKNSPNLFFDEKAKLFLNMLAEGGEYENQKYKKVGNMRNIDDNMLIKFITIRRNSLNDKNSSDYKNLENSYNSKTGKLRTGNLGILAQEAIRKRMFKYITSYKEPKEDKSIQSTQSGLPNTSSDIGNKHFLTNYVEFKDLITTMKKKRKSIVSGRKIKSGKWKGYQSIKIARYKDVHDEKQFDKKFLTLFLGVRISYLKNSTTEDKLEEKELKELQKLQNGLSLNIKDGNQNHNEIFKDIEKYLYLAIIEPNIKLPKVLELAKGKKSSKKITNKEVQEYAAAKLYQLEKRFLLDKIEEANKGNLRSKIDKLKSDYDVTKGELKDGLSKNKIKQLKKLMIAEANEARVTGNGTGSDQSNKGNKKDQKFESRDDYLAKWYLDGKMENHEIVKDNQIITYCELRKKELGNKKEKSDEEKIEQAQIEKLNNSSNKLDSDLRTFFQKKIAKEVSKFRENEEKQQQENIEALAKAPTKENRSILKYQTEKDIKDKDLSNFDIPFMYWQLTRKKNASLTNEEKTFKKAAEGILDGNKWSIDENKLSDVTQENNVVIIRKFLISRIQEVRENMLPKDSVVIEKLAKDKKIQKADHINDSDVLEYVKANVDDPNIGDDDKKKYSSLMKKDGKNQKLKKDNADSLKEMNKEIYDKVQKKREKDKEIKKQEFNQKFSKLIDQNEVLKNRADLLSDDLFMRQLLNLKDLDSAVSQETAIKGVQNIIKELKEENSQEDSGNLSALPAELKKAKDELKKAKDELKKANDNLTETQHEMGLLTQTTSARLTEITKANKKLEDDLIKAKKKAEKEIDDLIKAKKEDKKEIDILRKKNNLNDKYILKTSVNETYIKDLLKTPELKGKFFTKSEYDNKRVVKEEEDDQDQQNNGGLYKGLLIGENIVVFLSIVASIIAYKAIKPFRNWVRKVIGIESDPEE